MLIQTEVLPEDRPVAGVHVIPVTEQGEIVMGWNGTARLLETVGGRLEPGESIDAALRREAVEEAGLLLAEPFSLFGVWYWDSSDTYTALYLAQVAGTVPIPPGFETTGRVTFTFETVRQIIASLAHDLHRELRIEILNAAEERHRRGG